MQEAGNNNNQQDKESKRVVDNTHQKTTQTDKKEYKQDEQGKIKLIF
jgi:hypothetical protein